MPVIARCQVEDDRNARVAPGLKAEAFEVEDLILGYGAVINFRDEHLDRQDGTNLVERTRRGWIGEIDDIDLAVGRANHRPFRRDRKQVYIVAVPRYSYRSIAADLCLPQLQRKPADSCVPVRVVGGVVCVIRDPERLAVRASYKEIQEVAVAPASRDWGERLGFQLGVDREPALGPVAIVSVEPGAPYGLAAVDGEEIEVAIVAPCHH